MGKRQVYPGGDQEEARKNSLISIRTARGTHRPLAATSLPGCLFPAAILSFLTFAGTSWFLPDSAGSPLVSFGIVSGLLVTTVIVVTSAAVGPDNGT